MKKLSILVIVISLFLTNKVNSQTNMQMLDKFMDKMQNDLSLTQSRKDSLKTIMLGYYQQKKTNKQTYLTDTTSLKQANNTSLSQTYSQIQSILNAQEKEKFQSRLQEYMQYFTRTNNIFEVNIKLFTERLSQSISLSTEQSNTIITSFAKYYANSNTVALNNTPTAITDQFNQFADSMQSSSLLTEAQKTQLTAVKEDLLTYWLQLWVFID